LEDDRFMHPDMNAAIDLVRDNGVVEAADLALPGLLG
jgi:hypothetical protein